MILIGVLNVIIGYCSYTQPSDIHERIMPNVPYARGSGSAVAAVAPPSAADCPPGIAARIASELPGATIAACTPSRVTVMRGAKEIDLEIAGGDIASVGEILALPEIPADVMRAFAIAYPRTIPASAIKRTRRGAEPVYELAFPPGRPYSQAILRGDGSVLSVR